MTGATNTGEEGTALAEQSSRNADRSWWSAPVRAVERHPLIAVALVAAVIAAGHAVWIITHRQLGALDPDEAGYIASALRMHRSIDLLDPLRFVTAVAGNGNGPLVPLLAVPLLMIGPRSPLTVMMVQPALLVFTCVAIAGTTRRMAGPYTSFFTGISYLALPSAALATQSLWFGLGAAAAMAAAAWALVASERLTNRWTYGFGLAIACMLLARTMTIAFLPAVFAAGAVMAGRSRRSWKGLGKGGAVTVVVAGPWYALQFDSVFGYLFAYGYGERAGLFGSGGPLERLDFRLDRLGSDALYYLGETIVVVVVVAVVTIAWRWYRHGRRPGGLRCFTALSSAVVFGLAALVSTSNNGVWFELPLTALVVVLVGVLASRAWWPLRALLVGQVLLQTVLVAAVTWWLVTPMAGITAHYELGFQEYDERFEQGRRDEQPAAARDWWNLTRSVEAYLEDLERHSPRPLIYTVSGNMEMFNSNTLYLAGELDGWGPRIHIPDTTRDAAHRAQALTPRATLSHGPRTERVLVIARHDAILFTPDAQVAEFHQQARRNGWEPTTEFPMPKGGTVFILRHPDGSQGP